MSPNGDTEVAQTWLRELRRISELACLKNEEILWMERLADTPGMPYGVRYLSPSLMVLRLIEIITPLAVTERLLT